MTFSQELADRVREVATRPGFFEDEAASVLASVFYEAIGQYADLWIEDLRQDIRRQEEAAQVRRLWL